MLTINSKDFEQLTKYIKDNYGINLTQKKVLIEGRLSNTVVEKGYSNFGEYVKFVIADKTGKEVTQLLNKITTNHTFFMRKWSHFQYYRDIVLPYFYSTIKDHDLRIWSAGCSSGEEPYTLAMVNNDFFGSQKHLWDTKILATDISEKALDAATIGSYDIGDIEDVPTTWRMSYFKNVNNAYVISDKIRQDVIFRKFNLMNEQFPFKKRFHVIFCRNVMIYFDQETKNKLIEKFYDYTETGGYLFIGHSESINRDTTRYKYIVPAVYRKE